MDDLAFVRGRIESYADYTNDRDRLLSDEQIRAYAGEALARVLERLQPSGRAAESLAGVLLRCQFADQSVVRALDSDDVSPAEIAEFHAADRELVVLADRADSVDAGALEAYVAQLDVALDRRVQIALHGAAAIAPGPPAR